jgi:hypothetical protein
MPPDELLRREWPESAMPLKRSSAPAAIAQSQDDCLPNPHSRAGGGIQRILPDIEEGSPASKPGIPDGLFVIPESEFAIPDAQLGIPDDETVIPCRWLGLPNFRMADRISILPHQVAV